MSRIIQKLRKEESMELALAPEELALPSQLRDDIITRSANHVNSMVEALISRRSIVQENLNTLNEEMRQIEHVLQYALPALNGIDEGRVA